MINVAVASGNELENGDIESAAAEIVDGDFAALRFMQAIGERGRGRLVDKAQNLEAGDFASILRGLALGIVEIRGDGDDGTVDGFAEVGLGPTTLSSIRRGRRPCRPTERRRLEAVLGLLDGELILPEGEQKTDDVD